MCPQSLCRGLRNWGHMQCTSSMHSLAHIKESNREITTTLHSKKIIVCWTCYDNIVIVKAFLIGKHYFHTHRY